MYFLLQQILIRHPNVSTTVLICGPCSNVSLWFLCLILICSLALWLSVAPLVAIFVLYFVLAISFEADTRTSPIFTTWIQKRLHSYVPKCMREWTLMNSNRFSCSLKGLQMPPRFTSFSLHYLAFSLIWVSCVVLFILKLWIALKMISSGNSLIFFQGVTWDASCQVEGSHSRYLAFRDVRWIWTFSSAKECKPASWSVCSFRATQDSKRALSGRELAVGKGGSFQCLSEPGLAGSVETESESATCHLPALSRVSSTESSYVEEKPEESLEAVLEDVALRVFVESTTQVRRGTTFSSKTSIVWITVTDIFWLFQNCMYIQNFL